MKNLPAIQSSGLHLVAVAAVQKSVSRYKCAKDSGIQIFDDHLGLLTMDGLDLILECTGDERILSDIISRKGPNVGVLDRQASMRLIEMAKGYRNKSTGLHTFGSLAGWRSCNKQEVPYHRLQPVVPDHRQ